MFNSWNASNYVKDQMVNIKNEVGNDKLIIGVSGELILRRSSANS